MPRTLICTAIILSVMTVGSPSSLAAVDTVAEWRLHSAKACNLYSHDKYKEAINEYRRALQSAERDNIEPDVKADLQINIAEILTLQGKTAEAAEILDRLEKSVARDDSLLAMRYWRRRVRVAAAVGDVDAALEYKRHVVEIMSKYFHATSPQYILELYDYEACLLAARKLAEAAEIDERISKLIQRNLTRFARTICERSLRLSTQKFEEAIKATSNSPIKSPLLVRRIESILDRSLSPAGEQIFCASVIMRSADRKSRESAAKRILRVGKTDSTFAKETGAASLQLMFLRLYDEIYDEVTEKLARDAFDRFNAVSADKFGRMQATTMYSMVLAKRAKADEAERVIDTLRFSPDVMTDYSDFHPLYQARYEIAVQRARQHKTEQVRQQFKELRAQFALQPRIPRKVKAERLVGWQNEEDRLVREASN
ncbi:MAG: hypothetical protein K2X93_06275 [Candidatus Obscuribacterales bacterium]|nr:hypothetical protein [Candidatus Obscuribacterales bacterium]